MKELFEKYGSDFSVEERQSAALRLKDFLKRTGGNIDETLQGALFIAINVLKQDKKEEE